ncbi:MAG TPA: restriction endonuclease subunit S [Sideroxyarcus sp.]|nr:restriction endonuclease subunit S [Sideroxyarcus sp.]
MLLDVRPDHLQIVRDILQKHVPQYEVWAFGSRAKWTAKEYSDLDLCIVSDKPLSFSVLGAMGEAFSDSDLPWKVDVVDWATTSSSFRKIIERDKVVVKQRTLSLGDTVPFGTLFSLPQKNGLTRPKKVRGSGLPMVNMGELFAHARINDIEMDLVPVSDNEKAYLLEPGDLLFARQSLVREGSGQCSIFLGNSKPTVFESHLIRCRLNRQICNPEFYFNFFRSTIGRATMDTIIEQGAGASGIRGSDLVNLQVPFPPLEIQDSIATTLASLDDKITLLREANATLEAVAQALFKSWFVDFDPVRAKMEGREPEGMNAETAALFPDEFEVSELGEIPTGWRVGTLGEISRNVRAGARPDELTDETAYIGLEHMPRQSIALYDWDSASKVESGKSRFKKGQVLFGKLRPYFHKVGIAPLDGVCSTDILVIEPTSQMWHAFSVCHFSSKPLVEHATQLSNGAKMPRTNWSDLANYRIVIPPNELVLAFEGIVSSLFDPIPENVHQAKELAETRDTLLPRLMSGRLCIPQTIKLNEEAVA